jgi:hypothetical protein
MSEAAESDMASLLSNWSVMPEPDTCTRPCHPLPSFLPFSFPSARLSLTEGLVSRDAGLVKRYRAMVFKLIPVQVSLDLITEPTSSILTPVVILAFAEAAGDFTNVSPFCLLTARSSFIRFVPSLLLFLS